MYQLEKLEARYQELERLLASAEVISHKEQCSKYAKELSQLKTPVILFREYKKLTQEIENPKLLLREKHEREFIELAKNELQDLEVKKTDTEQKLKEVLSGEDEDLGRDVIIEIRQGTGGNEAGLFAADLYRMYTMYAQKKAGR